MTFTRTIRCREIYGIAHVVRSRYFCGVLIWRTTKPHATYDN
jgi:hypothetical protein